MDASLIWRTDVLSVVASHLQPNSITLLRFVDKTAASHFEQHDTIHLCEPVPSWAFTQRWSQPGACRTLSRDKRHQLTTSIAAVSDVGNLKAALAAAGLEPSEDQLRAAAKGGYLRTCLWLTEPGRLREEVNWAVVLISSAGSGERSICEWCLEHLGQCPEGVCLSSLRSAATNAASEGHGELMEWLLQLAPEVMDLEEQNWEIIRSSLEGCDLPTVEGLWERYGPQHTQPDPAEEWELSGWTDLLGAALRSPKDWRAKAEWVLAQAEELGGLAFGEVQDDLVGAALEPHPGQGPEAAVERLEWLKAQGFRPTPEALTCALGHGNLPGLRWLLSEGVVVVEASKDGGIIANLQKAAIFGRLDILQAMREVVDFTPELWSSIVYCALRGGHPAVLHWAADCLSPDELRRALEGAASTAGMSGCVQTLRWAVDHGVTLTEDAWYYAARSGSEAAVDLLAEVGCPKPVTGGPYRKAIKPRDWRLLPALFRAGVPLRPCRNRLYNLCRSIGAPSAVLRWFEAEAGVDPESAAEAAKAEDEEEAEARALSQAYSELEEAVEVAGGMEDLAWAKVERRRRKRWGERG